MSELTPLAFEECVALLACERVGRLAVVDGDQPVIYPVNFRVVARHSDEPVIVIRTHAGNALSRSGIKCAFEVDGIDPLEHTGWSVLVRGELRHIEPDTASAGAPFRPDEPLTTTAIDPQPWLDDGRDEWLLIVPHEITGRRLTQEMPVWAFSLQAYL